MLEVEVTSKYVNLYDLCVSENDDVTLSANDPKEGKTTEYCSAPSSNSANGCICIKINIKYNDQLIVW